MTPGHKTISTGALIILYVLAGIMTVHGAALLFDGLITDAFSKFAMAGALVYIARSE